MVTGPRGGLCYGGREESPNIHDDEENDRAEEGGGRSFQERRQTTRASLRQAGLDPVTMRSYLLERRAPPGAADHDYIQRTVFDRNWGERLRPLLTAADWTLVPSSAILPRLGMCCAPPTTTASIRSRSGARARPPSVTLWRYP